jgi:glycosyltransferase involved in cell wall biosynthesis
VQLTALVTTPEDVCCRYRVAAFRPLLEQAGWHLSVRPLPRSWWAWASLGKELAGADAVLLLRKLLHPLQLYVVRRAAHFFIFDLDDAIFLRDSYARRGLHSARRRRRFRAVASAADAVVAGNDFLREAACEAAGRQHAEVIPTCVNPTAYRTSRHGRRGPGVQAVWIGSSSTLQGLELARPLLERLGAAIPGLRLRLICDRFLRLEQLTVVPCPWSEGTEAADLAEADIGISWLPEDLWSRGKCGLKVLQYMAAGLPVVANPVGVQAEMVRHGKTGYLAETAGEWTEAVGRLARDPVLRRRMGEAGRRLVEAEFSVAAGARRWTDLLRQVRRRGEAA